MPVPPLSIADFFAGSEISAGVLVELGLTCLLRGEWTGPTLGGKNLGSEG